MTIDTQKLRDGPYLRDGIETRRIMVEAADVIDANAAEIVRLRVALAQQPSGHDREDADIDAAFEAVRQRLCKLPRYSFFIHQGGVQRHQDNIGNWLEFDQVHALFDPISVDTARAARSQTMPDLPTASVDNHVDNAGKQARQPVFGQACGRQVKDWP